MQKEQECNYIHDYYLCPDSQRRGGKLAWLMIEHPCKFALCDVIGHIVCYKKIERRKK